MMFSILCWHLLVSIFCLSQSNDIKLLKSAIRAGCTDFVLKPLQEEQLVLLTLKHLSNIEKEISFPGLIEHRKVHVEFQQKIEAILKRNEEDIVSNLELIKFNLFLKDWLIHHILIEDRKIGDFLLTK